MSCDREKLIELLKYAPFMKQTHSVIWVEAMAQWLIDNGVTFATDTNVLSKWISVEDRLPETDNKNTYAYNVLLYIPEREGCCQNGVYIGKLKSIKADDGSGNFWGLKRPGCDWTVWGFSYFEQPVVTHWQPLPEPPKEG